MPSKSALGGLPPEQEQIHRSSRWILSGWRRQPGGSRAMVLSWLGTAARQFSER